MGNALKKTIKFDPNKTTLRKSSYSTLNEVVAVVREFPWLDITVIGHSTASGSGCNRLTEGRAKTVIKYLTDKGATNKMKPEAKCKTFIGVEIKASGGSAPVPHAAIAECKKEKKVKHEKEVASKDKAEKAEKKERSEKAQEKDKKEKMGKAAKEKASKEKAAKAAEKAKKESDQKAEKAAKEKASKEKAAKAAEKAAKEKASKAEKASKEAAAKKAEKAAKENGYKAEKAKKAAEKDDKAKEKADKAKEKADKVAAEKKHKENAAKAVEKKAKEHLQKKQCNRDTGGTCRILGCYKSRGPTDCVSKKWHRLDAKCFCKYGLCAKGGKCYDAITGKFGGSEEEQEDVVEED